MRAAWHHIKKKDVQRHPFLAIRFVHQNYFEGDAILKPHFLQAAVRLASAPSGA